MIYRILIVLALFLAPMHALAACPGFGTSVSLVGPPVWVEPGAVIPDDDPDAGTCDGCDSSGRPTITVAFECPGETNNECACGQYATGDWWIRDPNGTPNIEITNIDPDYTTLSGANVNGWQIDPNSSSQGFDSRDEAGGQEFGPTFSSGLIPSPNNPTGGSRYSVSFGSQPYVSLVKAVSNRDAAVSDCSWAGSGPTNGPCLWFHAVFTFVKSEPAAGAYRPPYFGTAKPPQSEIDRWTVSKTRTDLIPIRHWIDGFRA